MKLRDIAIALFVLTAPVARSETLPVFVPLSQTDLDDPQVGYMHSSVGMEGGTFFFGKKGDPIEKIKKVELDRFLFYEDSKKEVLDGFTPSDSVCFFSETKTSWECFIHSSWNDVLTNIGQAYTKKLSTTYLTDTLICKDCKPIPEAGLSRLCSGYYQNYITGKEWKDKTMPTYPEVFNKDGNCIYEKPWTVSSKTIKTDSFGLSGDALRKSIVLQSTVNRCMIEEKILKKDDAIIAMKSGAKHTPELFNPVIKILENGETKSLREQQDFGIKKAGGCKNLIRLYLSSTQNKDTKNMLDILEKSGFNDDLLGRPKSYFDKKERVVKCKEPIQEFTLDYDSNPTDKQVEKLCSCVWNKFPEGRWERKEMRRMFKGEEPNRYTKKMVGRFGKAMKVCGLYEL